MKIKLIILYLFLFTLGAFAQEAPPVLSNFRVEDSNRDRIYFSASGDVSGLTTKGFSVPGKTILSLSTSELYIKISKPFNHYENRTIKLDGGNGVVPDFSLQFIQNKIKGLDFEILRYVSVIGGGDGKSIDKPWTLKQAFEQAKSGMTIYVKAGDYGGGEYQLNSSGTSSGPIKIIGYKEIPGDARSLETNPETVFSASEMPLIHKNYSGKYGDDGIDFNGNDYVILKNFQIEGYYYGVDASQSDYTTVDNCYVRDSYIGINFWKSSGGVTNSRVLNSYSSNARQDGILMNGQFGLIDGCYVSSNKDIGMDYYIGIIGSENGNGGHIIRNCEVVRFKNDSHTGHGIDLKAQRQGTIIENCLIENCTVSNLRQAISLRHHTVKYNVVRGVTARGDRNGDSNLITFRDDASYNIVENCLADNVNVAIKFNMSKEEDLGVQGGGHYNRIVNTIFDNCHTIIEVKGIGGVKPMESTNNDFINCTINQGDYMYKGSQIFPNSNSFRNSIISEVKEKTKSGKFSARFNHSNFYNSWNFESGNGNISKEPKFKKAESGDFRLNSDSPLIDKGELIQGINLDFDGNQRPQGKSIDIGAFEYQDNSTSSIRANAGDDTVICKGEAVNLTASGGNQYTWSNGETTKSIKVSPTVTTTYEVTVSDGNAFDKDQVTVTVDQVEANAGQDQTINEGEEATLTASGGDTYLWSNGETTENITVSPNTTTIFSVVVTTNACQAEDQVEVSVNKRIAVDAVVASAGDDITVCQGEEVTLTASGGSQYTWSNGETTASIKVRPSETTTFEVTVSEGNASDKDQVTVTVDQVEANAGQDQTIIEGEVVTLTASGGDTYLWSNGETTENITVSPNTTTTYSVTVTTNNCQAQDQVEIRVNQQTTDDSMVPIAGEDQVEIVEDVSENVSLEEEPKSLEIQVYPNPTTGILKLESINFHPDLDIHLINSTGQILYQDKTNSARTRFSKELDLSSYTKGIYFIRLMNSTQNEVKKVVLI